MASAGLDATAKQLVQDTVAELISVDEKAQNAFEKFVARRLVVPGDSTTASGPLNTRLLASVLTSRFPLQTLVAEYVSHLTGGSLQSVESLFEVAAALGAEPADIGLKPTELPMSTSPREASLYHKCEGFGRRTSLAVLLGSVGSARSSSASHSRCLHLGAPWLRSVEGPIATQLIIPYVEWHQFCCLWMCPTTARSSNGKGYYSQCRKARNKPDREFLSVNSAVCEWHTAH